MGIADQLGDTVSEHADQIEAGIDKVGDFIDSATGGKFADQVDKVQDFLKDKLPEEDES